MQGDAGCEIGGRPLTVATRPISRSNTLYESSSSLIICTQFWKKWIYRKQLENHGAESGPPNTLAPVGWELPPVGSIVISTAAYSRKERGARIRVPP
jgi:hypothetical protein